MNDNTINMSQYRGEVSVCRWCRPEQRLSGSACQWCMGSGYTAICLRCNGTGLETADAIWGSKTKHSSTCNICGGKGVLPSRKADYKESTVDAECERDAKPLVDASAQPMKNLAMTHPNATITMLK